MGKSDYLENQVLRWMSNNSPSAVPSTVYVALFTATPNDAGGGTEITGNAYARIAVVNSSANFTVSGNSLTNATAITSPTPSPSAWGTIVAFGVFDAASGGNLLWWGPVTPNVSTSTSSANTFIPGALTHTED